jgi:MtrB/PioB family decaheme-associated outer membrane protein
MRAAVLSGIILLLLSVNYSLAAEKVIGADIELKGLLADVGGSEAKFNEYRDIRDGLYGRFHLIYDSDYFVGLRASDIGYDTQSYGLEGGKLGAFKYHFFYSEIPHNFTFGAKSFYSGIGTDSLTYPVHPPSTDVSIWSDFDYSLERESYGGGIRLDMIKPFYVDASFSREDRDGIKPTAAAGTSPGGIAIELPEPVDYKTDTLKLEAGYAKKPLFVSVSYLYSRFENENENLRFRNPATENTASATDVRTLPPDNNYYKLSLKGSVRLPMNTKFGLNIASSRTRSKTDLLDYYVDNVPGGVVPVTLSDKFFHGKIDTRNYGFVLTSTPLPFLDGKMFYQYYKKKNKSDEITADDGEEILINEPFGYTKDNYGMELGFRLPANLYLLTAYTHVNKERDREDVPENKDDIYSIDLKWSGPDFLTVKAGYEKMHRTADFHAPGVSADDPEYIETFVRRFDVAAKDSDTYKASIDISPIENLSIGIGYRNKDADYDDVALGLRETKSDEFTVDADYTIGKLMTLTAYYDYEWIEYFQFQRQLPFNATSGFDPSTPATPTAFNWDSKQKDKSYDYGIGAEIYIIPKKLTVKLQHDYVRSNGNVDLTYHLGDNPLPAGRTQENIDISDWDDYRLRSYALKAVYNATKKLALSLGYIYEKFIFNDAQYEGYQFVPATSGTNGAFLTGAYKDQSYRADVVFFTVVYKF